ncbi:hypothetical protein FGG08_007478 [Glutinoglossum americanum]|uniref:Palmitoyltransferase PFA4 n=1 Tax=Glutinoglossum americanum TaxID=1670608 RepID=A0A9P8I386_9PEZI|nr:hypothetical protein FGG08_007478 [Glutinoglossum americanum]
MPLLPRANPYILALSLLILFLHLSSQYLFSLSAPNPSLFLSSHTPSSHPLLPPGPLSLRQKLIFNGLVACLWICWARAVWVDAGFREGDVEGVEAEGNGEKKEEGKGRWCKKCQRRKPERAHHCRVCGRCIPKMDHHCPWTANCVSHYTFPHFLRLLLYAILAMSQLEYHLLIRAYHLWETRHLPSYLGPPLLPLIHLLALLLLTTPTLLITLVLLLRSLAALLTNTYAIESWEIERHASLVRRARKLGGLVEAPGGERVRVLRQEFPFDVGVWGNVAGGMSSRNPLTWLNPLAPTPSGQTALSFPKSAIEDPSLPWPPPDPSRSHAHNHGRQQQQQPDIDLDVDAFRARQLRDLERRRHGYAYTFGSGGGSVPGGEEEEEEEEEEEGEGDGEATTRLRPAEHRKWMNSDGETLGDLGVASSSSSSPSSEEDEENIPLGELIRRRRRAAEAEPELDSKRGGVKKTV